VELAASGMQDAVSTWEPTDADDPELQALREVFTTPVALSRFARRDLRAEHQGQLEETIARRYDVEPSSVTLTLGASQAIMHVLVALVRAGDHVIVERPTYEPLHRVPALLGAEVSRLERKPEESWGIVVERLARLVTPKTRAIILSNLHNPSGAMIPRDVMRTIGDIADRVGAMVLVDEVYLDFVFDTAATANVAPAAVTLQNAVSWSSTTKAFGFGALRVGWIVTRDRDAAKAIRDAANYLHVEIPSSSAWAATQVLRRADALTRRANALSSRGLQRVRSWLEKERRVSWVEPAAGLCGVLQLPDLQADGPFAAHLRERYDTVVVPGAMFEAPGTVRIGFGAPPAMLEEGLANLSAALDDLG
jgi:aspartate/methionine/tyrosine aminotransferase